MAKHLTATDIRAIINTIYGWGDSTITWDGICDAVVSVIGKRPTRQSLNSHKSILSAYAAKKIELKTSVPKLAKPASLTIAATRIRNLESHVSDLQNQNSALLEYLAILQYNAYKKGMTEAELTQPLPKIDRERTNIE